MWIFKIIFFCQEATYHTYKTRTWILYVPLWFIFAVLDSNDFIAKTWRLTWYEWINELENLFWSPCQKTKCSLQLLSFYQSPLINYQFNDRFDCYLVKSLNVCLVGLALSFNQIFGEIWCQKMQLLWQSWCSILTQIFIQKK